MRVPTRERILNEVERLIAAKGVHGFKLREAAERLQLKVPAIYKHFRNRDDVLAGVARRFAGELAAQFDPAGVRDPASALRRGLGGFVEFTMRHPAYVRLAMAGFAMPRGATAGENALVAMQERLQRLLGAGARSGVFRRVAAADFYRIAHAALLVRLVFPDDRLLLHRPTAAEIRSVQQWSWDIARRFLSARRRA
jgi:AcrR family transcriptional regulator